ncbi:MAG TPA: NAD(P)-dependent oxidoreductase [Propionibacteriaceae bacterium]|nr:NAD(P)-dependent oxidoreductase [Propionibacteriaceae bacterium]
MSATTVLVTTRSFSSGTFAATAALQEAGLEVITGPSDHDLAQLRPLLAEAVAWIAGTGPVTAEHLDAAPKLRLVARYGVGVEAVDLEAAAQRDVAVTNTPGANSSAVADHALALILAALRRITSGDRGVRAGDWRVQRSHELGNLSVGLVGLGRIGRGVVQRLSGFGCEVLGHDPGLDEDELRSIGVQSVTLTELAARSDVVSLHAPGEQTLIDTDWLAGAKRGLVLVNTARAQLVDEAAVARALAEERLSAYATDTLSTEPGIGEAEASPLLAEGLRDLTVFTPHIGAQTVEAVNEMSRGAVAAVLALVSGGALPNLVSPESREA